MTVTQLWYILWTHMYKLRCSGIDITLYYAFYSTAIYARYPEKCMKGRGEFIHTPSIRECQSAIMHALLKFCVTNRTDNLACDAFSLKWRWNRPFYPVEKDDLHDTLIHQNTEFYFSIKHVPKILNVRCCTFNFNLIYVSWSYYITLIRFVFTIISLISSHSVPSVSCRSTVQVTNVYC